MNFGPAFKDGELQHVSASQLGNFDGEYGCRYKWYAEKVLKKPSMQDWSWSQTGVAIHGVLDARVCAHLGKEHKESDRPLSPQVMLEAEQFVDKFDWEKHFIGHEIVDCEMPIIYTQGSTDPNSPDYDPYLPKVVGAIDVFSIDEDGVFVATDWKTGYGSDKGLDAQAMIYLMATMENFGVNRSRFRRIYPRLPGEERGSDKIEVYEADTRDSARFKKIVASTSRQMQAVAKGEIKASCNPSQACPSCGIAYDCPMLKLEPIGPIELVAKLKVVTAAKKQIEDLLKKASEEDDLIIGDEVWGLSLSESFRLPKTIKKEQIPQILMSSNPQLLLEKASITVDQQIKNELESQGIDGIKNVVRKTLKFKNEDELKTAKKVAKKAEKTTADVKKVA